MYPNSYPSTTVSETSNISSVAVDQDEVEVRVQAVLTELEQLPQDVQLAIYTRLLNGLASKLTSAVVSKAVTAAKISPTDGKQQKASAAKRRTTSRRSGVDDVPRADSLLRQLNDPTDPIEAWQRFGGSAAQVFDVLRQEPSGVLEAMLMHRNMPAGQKPRSKAREKMAEAIALRLEQHFRGR